MPQEADFEDFGEVPKSGSFSRHALRSGSPHHDPGLEYEDQDPFPLFLYGDNEPEPPSVEAGLLERLLASRTFKLSVLTALVAIAVGAILALARLFGAFPGDKNPPARASVEPSPMVLVNNLPISRATAPPDATTAPTRQDIAAAFNSVRQQQADNSPPPASPAPPKPAPPPRQLDPDEIAAMIKRARSLIAIGDIAAARLLLTRASDAQEPSAAFLLAQTYDPAVLGAQDARSITPDPAAARNWYQRAAQLGSTDAQQRLAQMKE